MAKVHFPFPATSEPSELVRLLGTIWEGEEAEEENEGGTDKD